MCRKSKRPIIKKPRECLIKSKLVQFQTIPGFYHEDDINLDNNICGDDCKMATK